MKYVFCCQKLTNAQIFPHSSNTEAMFLKMFDSNMLRKSIQFYIYIITVNEIVLKRRP